MLESCRNSSPGPLCRIGLRPGYSHEAYAVVANPLFYLHWTMDGGESNRAWIMGDVWRAISEWCVHVCCVIQRASSHRRINFIFAAPRVAVLDVSPRLPRTSAVPRYP